MYIWIGITTIDQNFKIDRFELYEYSMLILLWNAHRIQFIPNRWINWFELNPKYGIINSLDFIEQINQSVLFFSISIELLHFKA